MRSSPEPTDISLVMPTRNRAATLQQTLEVLLSLSPKCRADLVIVDNGSSDTTWQLLTEFTNRSALPVRIVAVDKPGSGRARNVGWHHARGRIVAFTDDDCYPDRAYLDRAIEAMSDPQVGFVGGRILLFDPTDLRITVRDDPDPQTFLPGSRVPVGAIHGANLIVRRDSLEAVGGYDDNLGAGTRFGGDDIDLVQRLSTAGWRGRYDPGPVVAHHHRRKTPNELHRLMRWYDEGRGAHYAKCMLVPELRWRILRTWIRTSALSPRLLYREVRAAVVYLWLRATGQLDPSPAHRA